MITFGEYVKSLRMIKEITLREFCLRAEIDPSNWSKIERGVLPPIKGRQVIENISRALELKPNSDEYNTLFDLAIISHIPTQLIDDKTILEKLPIFFRTARGESPSRDELMEIAKIIKEE
jgi:transcriptional regulator with XRE-family HTH domain